MRAWVLVSALGLACGLAAAASAAQAEAARPPSAQPGNPQAVSGTWVLQQVASAEQLRRLVPRVLGPALRTPHVRGFSLRVPWKAIDADLKLLEAGLKTARQHNVAFSVRFMAGRHTPARPTQGSR